jgi:nitroreductase
MPQDPRVSGPLLFEVVLYFDSNLWLFSTYAYSSHSRAALEFAEREFSVHALRHKLGKVRARSAWVTDQFNNYYFAKKNGRWQLESNRTRSKPARVARIRVFEAEGIFSPQAARVRPEKCEAVFR